MCVVSNISILFLVSATAVVLDESESIFLGETDDLCLHHRSQQLREPHLKEVLGALLAINDLGLRLHLADGLCVQMGDLEIQLGLCLLLGHRRGQQRQIAVAEPGDLHAHARLQEQREEVEDGSADEIGAGDVARGHAVRQSADETPPHRQQVHRMGERGVGGLSERSELEDGAVVRGEVLRGREREETPRRREPAGSDPSATPAACPDG